MLQRNRNAALLLLLGDLVALFLFVLVGQADHQVLSAENPLLYALRSSLPFLLVWLLVAVWQDAFDPAILRTWRLLLARTLTSWLIAAPLALLVRGLWLARGAIPLLFLAATLGFGFLFLLAWRVLFALFYRRRQRG